MSFLATFFAFSNQFQSIAIYVTSIVIQISMVQYLHNLDCLMFKVISVISYIIVIYVFNKDSSL